MEVQGGYKLQPGDRAPPFVLRGVDGEREAIFELASFAGARSLVVAFWCNHCPYVRSYERRFVEWAERARREGVGIVAINANDEAAYPEDDWAHMVVRAREQRYPFPYLRDEDQRVAREYGAQCTPHFLVFDRDFRLAYQGRFDDDRDNAERAKQRYVPEAVEALLAGRAPSVAQSWAIGCSIKWG
jgi:thiol-disulfide isomerase/thioredoxin